MKCKECEYFHECANYPGCKKETEVFRRRELVNTAIGIGAIIIGLAALLIQVTLQWQ